MKPLTDKALNGLMMYFYADGSIRKGQVVEQKASKTYVISYQGGTVTRQLTSSNVMANQLSGVTGIVDPAPLAKYCTLVVASGSTIKFAKKVSSKKLSLTTGETGNWGASFTKDYQAVPAVLPSLPLTLPKVLGFGHSYQLNALTYLSPIAGNTAINTSPGLSSSGRGVLSCVEVIDGGRYNLDIFTRYQGLPTGLSVSGGQGYGGRIVSRGGAALRMYPSGITLDLNTLVSDVLARSPDIVYFDAIINDLIYGHHFGQSLSVILDDYRNIVESLHKAGVWIILQTVCWANSGTFPANSPDWADWLNGANDMIKSYSGKYGYFVNDTTSFDGLTSDVATNPAFWLVDGVLHPSDKLAAKRADNLITILQSMTTNNERRNLNETSSNIFPYVGLGGTSGTKTGTATSGNVATGLIVAGPNTGTSSMVLSKEVVSASPVSEKQVISITNGTPGGTTAAFTIKTVAAPTLTSLGLAQGDWLEGMMYVELDNWAGWDFNANSDGPIKMTLGLYNNTTLAFQAANGASLRNRGVWLRMLLEIPQGVTADNIRSSTVFIAGRWNTTVAGTGVAKLSKVIWRKVSSPRGAWNLT